MKRSIFYLDDEVSCVDIFQRVFCDEFDVRTATTVADARRILCERPADIIITDQRMPEIDGTEFLREVAEQYPLSLRVMLTGSAMVGDVLHDISQGTINLFVAKPWAIENMRHILKRAYAAFAMDYLPRAEDPTLSNTPVIVAAKSSTI